MTQLNTHVHELKKVTNFKEKKSGKKSYKFGIGFHMLFLDRSFIQ